MRWTVWLHVCPEHMCNFYQIFQYLIHRIQLEIFGMSYVIEFVRCCRASRAPSYSSVIIVKLKHIMQMLCYVAFASERYVNKVSGLIRRSVTAFGFSSLHWIALVLLLHYKSYCHCVSIADSRCEGNQVASIGMFLKKERDSYIITSK